MNRSTDNHPKKMNLTFYNLTNFESSDILSVSNTYTNGAANDILSVSNTYTDTDGATLPVS